MHDLPHTKTPRQAGLGLRLIDPGYAVQSGHHHSLNTALLQGLLTANRQPSLWCDQSLPATIHRIPIFQGVGYGASDHWHTLPVTLKLAQHLQQQLVAAEDSSQSVSAWLAHSLLPFQLLGLARFLASQPPGLVILSLMFDPTETLSSSAEPIHSNDQRSCSVALLELARACRHAGHQLRLGAASKHTIERYRPLLEQARLPIPSLHPAVCGAGCPITATPRKQDLPLVLLHWGDLKADKGRHEALALVQALLSGWQPVHPCRFVFHSYSHLPLEPQEQQQLQDAQKRLGEMVLWLPAYMPQAEMQNLLASCEVALLAYNPENYAHRSSGVLLCYAAARYAACMPATAIGYGGHWLQEEAAAWGMSWQVATPAVSRDAPLWQAAINKALTTARKAQPTWTPYAKEVFGRSFVDWVLEQLPP